VRPELSGSVAMWYASECDNFLFLVGSY